MPEKKKAEEALDISNLDTSVDPAEDFYTYANGGWIKKHPLPSEFSRFGTFDKLADDNNIMLRELIEGLSNGDHEKGSLADKLGTFYKTGMDNKLWTANPVKVLNQIHQFLPSFGRPEAFPVYLAALHKNGISAFFGFFASPDSKNASLVLPHIAQGGLGLPERDYYTEKDKRSLEIQEAYKKHIEKIFSYAGHDPKQIKKSVTVVYNIEQKLALASMTRLERRDPHKTYHKFSVDQLLDHTPDFNWKEYFHAIDLDEPADIVVMQPDFLSALQHILEKESLKDISTYCEWQLLKYAAPFLSEVFVNENFAFYGQFLSGTETIKPRWKQVLATTNQAMGDALGKLYVEKYFPPQAKTRMLTLVGNLKAALAQRISNVEWMSEKTKTYAIEKLHTIQVKIGYPDKWRNYSDLQILDDHYLLNMLRANTFEFSYMVSKIYKPVDREEWFMPPQTVNAYYSPNLNEICFPAGILQPPFFYAEADDALNYGAIGMVIGHEMTHGFDDQGRHYDKSGNLVNWWTDEDVERFNERTKILVEQFNRFEVSDGVFANGELTLGENIADLGGLNVALTAYKMANQEELKKTTEGYTGLQRFYLAYAHVWAQNIRPQEVLRRVKEDVHSLGDLRVNGPLPNMKEFQEAFDIKPEDNMYLSKDKMAKIW